MRPSLVAELFPDASYAIALSSISGKHHEQALTLARCSDPFGRIAQAMPEDSDGPSAHPFSKS